MNLVTIRPYHHHHRCHLYRYLLIRALEILELQQGRSVDTTLKKTKLQFNLVAKES